MYYPGSRTDAPAVVSAIFEGRLIDLGPGLRMLRDLPAGSHVSVCLSSVAMRRMVQAAFLADGLSEWLCVYAAQDEPIDRVREELYSAGLPRYADPAVLRFVRGRDLYGDPAHPDFAQWTGSVARLYDDARRADRRGLRWTGDLPIAFARRGLHEELRALEESVGTQFPGPYTILCTYEVPLRQPTAALLGAFRAHEERFLLTGGQPGVHAGPPTSVRES
jgi:hypothetical protein